MLSLYRLLLTILLVGFLRLLTLAEAAAHPHLPHEAARADAAVPFDSPAAAASPSVRGSFEPDYFDFTAKALWPSTGFWLLAQAESALLPAPRAPLLAHAQPGAAGVRTAPHLVLSPAAPAGGGRLLPVQLHRPPYYATAPPLSR